MGTRIKPEQLKSPEHQVIVDLLRVIRQYTVQHGGECIGQCTLKASKDSVKPPTVVMYASYANGDYLCWFNDNLNFTMYALVNEKFNHILTVPADQIGKLLEEATKLKEKLGK